MNIRRRGNGIISSMYFPLFVDLGGRPCLVVGSGAVASRKAAQLAAFGADVRVVSPEASGRGFEDADADGMALVVAATDDPSVNARVAAACRARSIPVNVVDDPANCTFVFPAIFAKDPVVVAVSTGGASPVAARVIRDRVARAVPDALAAKVAELGARRAELKRAVPDAAERRRLCEKELEEWKD